MTSVFKLTLVSIVFALVATDTAFVNRHDFPFTFNCMDYQTIGSIYSAHNNDTEDRLFAFTCKDVLSGFTDFHPNCTWTDYVNGYDELVHFTCPSNKYLNGIGSVHNNTYEDRVFKFRCCGNQDIHMEDYELTGWTNTFDGVSDFKVDDGAVLKGVVSIHSNFYEDRRFDYETCNVRKFTGNVVIVG